MCGSPQCHPVKRRKILEIGVSQSLNQRGEAHGSACRPSWVSAWEANLAGWHSHIVPLAVSPLEGVGAAQEPQPQPSSQPLLRVPQARFPLQEVIECE